MILEVHMEPLAGRGPWLYCRCADELLSNTLSAGGIGYQSVLDGSVHLTVPDHIHKTDEAVAIARYYPAQAQALEYPLPIVVYVRMIEALCMELVQFVILKRPTPFVIDRHGQHHRKDGPNQLLDPTSLEFILRDPEISDAPVGAG